MLEGPRLRRGLEPGWLARLGTGHKGTLARALTLVENRQLPALAWVQDIAPRLGRAYVIGVTGWPGVGKSTLTAGLIGELRRRELGVAVLAIDPSSERSGGAVLGDRVRMLAHGEDPGVFIRSLASRGSKGGMAACTLEAVDLLDIAGYGVILVETVGAGQTQTEVLDLADAVVLVTAPGLGDDIQAIKGGILEIPDVIVVNQADRPGAERTKATLRWLAQGDSERRGRVQVLTTVATEGKGVAALWESLETLKQEQAAGEGQKRRARRQRRRVFSLLEQLWGEALKQTVEGDDGLRRRLEAAGGEDPYDLALELARAAGRRLTLKSEP
ncbi:hypothetical protein BH24DEI1_BH24DEI1_03270 [soil metagenome]|jgi:LAO/AO transport system ATPase|nr:methylmalonyl Co-A mutase-associated GTPase MeaB [Deinococcota bacterium]